MWREAKKLLKKHGLGDITRDGDMCHSNKCYGHDIIKAIVDTKHNTAYIFVSAYGPWAGYFRREKVVLERELRALGYAIE